MKSPFRIGFLLVASGLGVCLLTLMLLTTTHRAEAQVTIDGEPLVWEYTTTNVDTGSLQAKLTELGLAGWNVFALTNSDSKVESGNDGQAHVIAQRIEITAKRPRKK